MKTGTATTARDVWLTRMAGFAALVLLVVGASESFAAEDNTEQRVTRSAGAAITAGPNATDLALAEAEEETQDPLQTDGERKPTGAKETKLAAPNSYSGFWIYSATTELLYDFDFDGYFHFLRVRFDADTDFVEARVYARLYLSLDGGPWNPYYTTDDFNIYGTSGTDDYEVATELISGYPRGLYDVLIELYDADFHDLVAEIGPFETSALGLLPLEDRGRDGTVSAPPPPVSRSSGGGGGLGFWTLGILALALLRDRRRS